MNVSRAIIRNFATSGITKSAAAKDVPKGYFELKKVQEAFQQHDGKPVFLKRGALDQTLYRLTMGLSVVGLGGILKLIYDLSYPKME